MAVKMSHVMQQKVNNDNNNSEGKNLDTGPSVQFTIITYTGVKLPKLSR